MLNNIIVVEVINWIEVIFSYIPGKTGTFLRMIWYRYRWKFPMNVRVRMMSEFIQPKNIEFRGSASLSKNTFFSALGGKIIIEEGFSSNINLHLNSSGGGVIEIKKNVLIGPNVIFRTANHKFSSPHKTIVSQGHSIGNITIEEDVWIGSNCVILPNVTVGKGAIIAAGAIVNRDVSPYTVVGGVPARKIKDRK